MYDIKSTWTLNSGVMECYKWKNGQLSQNGGITGAPRLAYAYKWFAKVIYMLFYHGQERESFYYSKWSRICKYSIFVKNDQNRQIWFEVIQTRSSTIATPLQIECILIYVMNHHAPSLWGIWLASYGVRVATKMQFWPNLAKKRKNTASRG